MLRQSKHLLSAYIFPPELALDMTKVEQVGKAVGHVCRGCHQGSATLRLCVAPSLIKLARLSSSVDSARSCAVRPDLLGPAASPVTMGTQQQTMAT